MKNQIADYGFKKYSIPPGNNPYIRKVINGKRYKMHRWIMEQHLGRKLNPDEHVHHINEDPKDNRLENLQLLTAEEHGRLHKQKK